MSKVERTPSRKKLDEKKKSEKEKKVSIENILKSVSENVKNSQSNNKSRTSEYFRESSKISKNVKIRMILSIFRKVFSE
tara:strand:+ start:384 stop:620 length:237 start_codon:yes stop_codon:yes gene_type:complete